MIYDTYIIVPAILDSPKKFISPKRKIHGKHWIFFFYKTHTKNKIRGVLFI